MSDQSLYWLYMGLIFVISMGISILIIRKTNRLAPAFWISTVVNAGSTLAAVIWWLKIDQDHFSRLFHAGFYGIAFLNTMVLSVFACMSIQKKNPR